MHARTATLADAEDIAHIYIYNQGIKDCIAAFETCLCTVEGIHAWFKENAGTRRSLASLPHVRYVAYVGPTAPL
jgi:hypothetical protein